MPGTEPNASLVDNVHSSIYMRAVYEELVKSGKKCEKLGKIGKKSALVAPDSNISIPYRQ